jgi:KDO2-lipid IV(A) lauroyltransferase
MFFYVLYRLGQFIALSLPLKMAYGFAVFCSDAHYLFARQDRLAVRDNLRVIFPQKQDREICRIRLSMYRNFAKYLVDFFRFPKIDKSYIEKKLRIENRHFLDQAAAARKGVIMLTAHIGNWELGGVALSLLGYPLSAVALPHKNKRVNDFFIRQRESKGLMVITLGRAARQCLEALKQNKFLALVGDRDFGENGVRIDFFGKPALFPRGPAAFALKTGAIILPGFMARNPDGNFTLRIEKPLEFRISGDPEKDTREIVFSYKAIFEKYIREYADQWYMFRRFWLE